MEQLKYPIGRFKSPDSYDDATIAQYIQSIGSLPQKLQVAVEGLSEAQLDTPYRPEGWTIRQVVHHLADSHMNSFARFKLSLTEDQPTIKPYFEARWAEMPDGKKAPVDTSLLLLQGLHQRWVILLENMLLIDLKKGFVHPEQGREFPLNKAMALYAWHGEHHLAHINNTKVRLNW